MDATINPVSGVTSQPYTAPVSTGSAGSAASAVPLTKPAPVPDAAPQAPQATASNDAQYEAALRQAALSFKNVYAVSDQQFSIFKDATGKYITRYVSLRDGTVTYVPEPTLVKHIQERNPGSVLRIAINA